MKALGVAWLSVLSVLVPLVAQGAALPAPAEAVPAPVGSEDCERSGPLGLVGLPRLPRPPIRIEGDAGFHLGNGVIGGTGVAGDPFVISGWDIRVNELTRDAVVLVGTTAHVRLVALRVAVEGELLDPPGAALVQPRHGIHLVDARNVSISDATVARASGSALRIEGGSTVAVDCFRSWRATFGAWMDLGGGSDVVITRSNFTEDAVGVSLDAAGSTVRIADSRVDGATNAGWVSRSLVASRVEWERDLLQENPFGILIEGTLLATTIRVVDTLFVGNGMSEESGGFRADAFNLDAATVGHLDLLVEGSRFENNWGGLVVACGADCHATVRASEFVQDDLPGSERERTAFVSYGPRSHVDFSGNDFGATAIAMFTEGRDATGATVLIEGNVVADAEYAGWHTGTGDVGTLDVKGNRVERSWTSFFLHAPDALPLAARVRDNHVADGIYGFVTEAGPAQPGVVYERNTLVGNFVGLRVAGQAAMFANNTFAGNFVGVSLEGDCARPAFRGNNVAGNVVGWQQSDAHDLSCARKMSKPHDISGNWWGAASGPSGIGAGSGDAVRGLSLDFEPWLAAPSAGAPA